MPLAQRMPQSYRTALGAFCHPAWDQSSGAYWDGPAIALIAAQFSIQSTCWGQRVAMVS